MITCSSNKWHTCFPDLGGFHLFAQQVKYLFIDLGFLPVYPTGTHQLHDLVELALNWSHYSQRYQKKDYIMKQLRKDTSSIYKKSTHFLQLAMKLWHWTACKGLYLQKKNCVYQALSLSLSLSSTGRESKGRGQGELDLINWVQPPNCHFQPMCSVPGQCPDHYF